MEKAYQLYLIILILRREKILLKKQRLQLMFFIQIEIAGQLLTNRDINCPAHLLWSGYLGDFHCLDGGGFIMRQVGFFLQLYAPHTCV